VNEKVAEQSGALKLALNHINNDTCSSKHPAKHDGVGYCSVREAKQQPNQTVF